MAAVCSELGEGIWNLIRVREDRGGGVVQFPWLKLDGCFFMFNAAKKSFVKTLASHSPANPVT